MSATEITIEKSRRRKRKLVIEGNVVRFVKKLEHSFELPPEIAEWAKAHEELLDWLVFDSPASTSLRHPHSIRTLIYLLYARANNIPITQMAKIVGIAHEQLYRLERLLSRTGVKDVVYKMLKAQQSSEREEQQS